VAHHYLRKKAQGKTAKQALVVVAVKLLHAVYAMLSIGSPTTPHVSSSRRRRLGLDISWDVSVEDGAGGSLAEGHWEHQRRQTFRSRT